MVSQFEREESDRIGRLREHNATLRRNEVQRDANWQRDANLKAEEARKRDAAAVARNRAALEADAKRNAPPSFADRADIVTGLEEEGVAMSGAWFARSKAIPGVVANGNTEREAVRALDDILLYMTNPTFARPGVVTFGDVLYALELHGWRRKLKLGKTIVLEHDEIETEIVWPHDASHKCRLATRNYLLELGGIEPRWFEDTIGLTAKREAEEAKAKAERQLAAQREAARVEAEKAARREQIERLKALGV